MNILVSLGGFTVTKIVFENLEVGTFYAMGGFVNSYPFSPDGEFNQRMDFDAFNYCVSRDHKIVTIDSGDLSTKTDIIDWKFDGNSPIRRAASIFLHNCITAGNTTVALWDHIAVLAMLHPNQFNICTQTDKFGNTLNQLVLIGDYTIMDSGHDFFK